MSFEGYYQVLCTQGHRTIEDVHAFDDDNWQCPECSGDLAYSNLIDTTNGEEDGFEELELLHLDKCEVCSSILEKRYKIPKEHQE